MFPCNNLFPKGFTLNSESSTPFTKSLVKNGQTFNTQASPQHTQALSLSLSLSPLLSIQIINQFTKYEFMSRAPPP